MKIAFLVDRFPAISETFVLGQITRLIDRGHDVCIFARKKNSTDKKHKAVCEYDLKSKAIYQPSIPDTLLLLLVKLVYLYIIQEDKWFANIHNFLWLSYENRNNSPLPKLYRGLYLLGQDFDIIHCQHGHIADTAIMFKEASLLSSPVITTFYGFDINVYPLENGRGCYERLFSLGDWFTVGSGFARDRLIDLGAPPERIEVWPMGISVHEFSFRERSREEGPVRLLSVGRLVEEKGFEYAMRAVDCLARQGRRVEYRIVGDGVLRPRLEKLVESLNLGEVVSLLGAMPREDVKHQYDWAHIFIMPSVTSLRGAVETQGLVLAEAQACGLPVVATEIGGIPEGICNESGILAPEKEVSALADQLASLIDRPERWSDMGKAGRRYVEEKYDCKKLISNIIYRYKNLI